MASGFLGACFWASFLERAVGLLRLGRAQRSTWWWQLGSLGCNATLRPQLIQEHRQSQGNYLPEKHKCRMKLWHTASWKQVSSISNQMSRECLYFVTWKSGVSRKTRTASSCRKFLHTSCCGLAFWFLVVFLIFFIETGRSIISASWSRYAWGLYCEKKGKIKGRKKLRRKKKIETKIFLVGMLSLYSVSTMVSWLLSRYQPNTNGKLKL